MPPAGLAAPRQAHCPAGAGRLACGEQRSGATRGPIMRLKIQHLALLVLVAAIAFAIHRSFWGPDYKKAKVVFGAYLAVLVTSTIAACYSEPRWRRPWLGYAALNWAWLIAVLRHYLGMVPDVYSQTMMASCGLGMAFGIFCALACYYLPGMRASPPPGAA